MDPNFVKYLVGIVILLCGGFFLLSSTVGMNSKYSNYFRFRTSLPFFDKWNECLQNRISPYRNSREKLWRNLAKGVRNCEELDSIKKLRLESFRNGDETKWHITPKNGESSTIITLGVGHDTKAEESLKLKLSKDSKFFGADPMVETNEALYSRFGNFFPFAIGANAGLSTASVLKNNTYINKTVVHVDLVYFLTEILKTKFVDEIWMDAENAEYELLPFFYQGGALDRNGITVCQLNVEIHNPDDAKKQALHDFIFTILADRRYGVFRPVQIQHLRLYLLNFEDKVCVDRYISIS